jgi:hypothetical protein
VNGSSGLENRAKYEILLISRNQYCEIAWHVFNSCILKNFLRVCTR